MPTKYETQAGDSIASVAKAFGFFPDTVWKDAGNAELRKKRGNPYILLAGDIVAIPDLREKTVDKPDGKHYQFRRKGVPETLKFRLLADGQPRKHVEYTVEIEGRLQRGVTDDQGVVEMWVPPEAKDGKLLIANETYLLKLGGLPPLSEEVGIRARLLNLGFLSPADASDEVYQQAIEAFQARYSLKITGDADDDTQTKLRDVHGC